MDFFSYEGAKRIGSENILVKVDQLIDWSRFSRLLKRAHIGKQLGPTGYDPLLLFKCLLLGQWHGLSDPQLEESLKIRLDFMLFAGLDLHSRIPDETTHCRFRNHLVAKGLFDDFLNEVCFQLEEHGLKLKKAETAIVDATLIDSSARPNKVLDTIAQDREEDKTGCEIAESLSADPDARWVKKGRKSTFGYKGFVRCDEEGFVDCTHVTPLSEAESPQLEKLADGAKAKRFLADKAYASKANRKHLKDRKIKDGIMHKAVRNRPLRASQKRFNKFISKRRFRVEQVFGTAKRLFDMDRARYFSTIKTHAQLTMIAICMNLLKAANKIKLCPESA